MTRISLKARAFALWRYCQTHGWDKTYDEVADGLGWSRNNVDWVIRRMGWQGRLTGGRAAMAEAARMQWCRRRATFDENEIDLVDLLK